MPKKATPAKKLTRKPAKKVAKVAPRKKTATVKKAVEPVYTLAAGKVLVLRTCSANLRSWNGFTWPASGTVAAKDWKDDSECGHGLHGLLWGEGNGQLLNWDASAKWLVVEVDAKDVRDLRGKVKFPKGVVVFCGDRVGATDFLRLHDLLSSTRCVNGGTATAGDGGTATAGDRGTATAGDGGTATAGDGGTATAGDRGTATAGYGGTATAGYGGTATAGEDGVLVIQRWNGKRYRFTVADVDGVKIRPNVAYRLDDDGQFVEA